MGIDLLIYLLIWLVQYLVAKKAGASSTTAALIATAGTGLAYKYDIAGVVKDTLGIATPTPGNPTGTPTSSSASLWDSLKGVLGLGAGLGAGAAAASAAGSLVSRYLPWLVGGAIAYFVFFRGRKETVVVQGSRT